MPSRGGGVGRLHSPNDPPPTFNPAARVPPLLKKIRRPDIGRRIESSDEWLTAQFVMSNVVLASRTGRYDSYHFFCAALPA